MGTWDALLVPLTLIGLGAIGTVIFMAIFIFCCKKEKAKRQRVGIAPVSRQDSTPPSSRDSSPTPSERPAILDFIPKPDLSHWKRIDRPRKKNSVTRLVSPSFSNENEEERQEKWAEKKSKTTITKINNYGDADSAQNKKIPCLSENQTTVVSHSQDNTPRLKGILKVRKHSTLTDVESSTNSLAFSPRSFRSPRSGWTHGLDDEV